MTGCVSKTRFKKIPVQVEIFSFSQRPGSTEFLKSEKNLICITATIFPNKLIRTLINEYIPTVSFGNQLQVMRIMLCLCLYQICGQGQVQANQTEVLHRDHMCLPTIEISIFSLKLFMPNNSLRSVFHIFIAFHFVCFLATQPLTQVDKNRERCQQKSSYMLLTKR